MSSPATVQCRGPCRRVVFSGGRSGPDGVEGLPYTDGQQVLTDYADSSCPVGGLVGGCPNTREAQAEADLDRPATRRELANHPAGRDIAALIARLAAVENQVTALRDRQPALAHAIYPLPALGVGAQDVALTWNTPLSQTPARAVVVPDLPAPAEGAVNGTVKTLTATGVTLTVTTTRSISAGGRLRVLAAGWT